MLPNSFLPQRRWDRAIAFTLTAWHKYYQQLTPVTAQIVLPKPRVTASREPQATSAGSGAKSVPDRPGRSDCLSEKPRHVQVRSGRETCHEDGRDDRSFTSSRGSDVVEWGLFLHNMSVCSWAAAKCLSVGVSFASYAGSITEMASVQIGEKYRTRLMLLLTSMWCKNSYSPRLTQGQASFFAETQDPWGKPLKATQIRRTVCPCLRHNMILLWWSVERTFFYYNLSQYFRTWLPYTE